MDDWARPDATTTARVFAVSQGANQLTTLHVPRRLSHQHFLKVTIDRVAGELPVKNHEPVATSLWLVDQADDVAVRDGDSGVPKIATKVDAGMGSE